jgi:hypothetical protein
MAHMFGCCLLAYALAGAAAPAAAQTTTLDTPHVEIGAGLQFLHIPDETYPFGWNLDLSGPIGDHAAVRWVGEGGMARDTPFPVQTLNFYHLGAGVRFMPSQRRYAAPYFQILGGAAFANQRISSDPSIASSNGVWAPMVQPGIGVSVPMNRFLNIIGQGDYRLAIFNGQMDNEFRLSVGARFMLW